MNEPHSNDEKNLKPYYFDDLLQDTFNFLKKAFRYLLGMNIEKKNAISITIIIMTLSFFLGTRNVFFFNHVLCISYAYDRYDGLNPLISYLANYTIFAIVWSPAIYLLNLYWNSKTIKFRLSLAYAVGLLTYRLSNNEWGLYDFDNLISCFVTTALFVSLAAILIHFVREVKE